MQALIHILNPLPVEGEHLRHELSHLLFEDFSSTSKQANEFFPLEWFHSVIKLSQVIDHYIHSLSIEHVVRH